MRGRFVSYALLVLFFVSTSVFAHHGSAGYDYNALVTLTGVITSVELVNPHSFVYIDVKNTSGQVESWALEGASPNVLVRHRGITRETLKPGVTITVIGAPPRAETDRLSEKLAYSKDATERLKTCHVLQVKSIKLQDGTTLGFGMGSGN
jgi:hypothetical protein